MYITMWKKKQANNRGLLLYYFITFRTPELAFPRMKWYLKLQWVFHNVADCAALVVTVYYWCGFYERECFIILGLPLGHVASISGLLECRTSTPVVSRDVLKYLLSHPL